jgi:predicted DNA-binding protein (MmcQ/YjbR family)
MYADDDPHLDDVRRVCLALPEAVEIEAWGRPTFRAGAKGKMFAIFEGDETRPYGLVFKPEPGERAALLQDEQFWSPAYYGPSGWLALDLTTGKPDWDEVAELVTGSYRQVALKRQLKALEEA